MRSLLSLYLKSFENFSPSYLCDIGNMFKTKTNDEYLLDKNIEDESDDNQIYNFV